MKQVGQIHVAKNGAGSVKLIPQEPEDMWHVYNLVSYGDHLSGSTVRKVQMGNYSERVALNLEIEVETIEYDRVSSTLRFRGKNFSKNDYVKIGAYHTLELELKRPFVLSKETWDAMALDYLEHACDPTATADLAAEMLQEGLAHICLVGASVTVTKAKVKTSIPRKHGGAIHGYDAALQKFFREHPPSCPNPRQLQRRPVSRHCIPGFYERLGRHEVLKKNSRHFRVVYVC